MTEKDLKQLNIEVQHIFESGANEVRIIEMVKEFIRRRDEANKLPIDPISESLKALKKIVSENTIELLSLTSNDQYSYDLQSKTEFAIKSIEAIK